MGFTKNIHFKKLDIWNKLNEEENASDLISTLLEDHYKRNGSMTEQKVKSELRLLELEEQVEREKKIKEAIEQIETEQEKEIRNKTENEARAKVEAERIIEEKWQRRKETIESEPELIKLLSNDMNVLKDVLEKYLEKGYSIDITSLKKYAEIKNVKLRN